MQKLIYLDYNSTTPVDQRVLEVMQPMFNSTFGNPSSTTHMFGLQAKTMIDNARKQVSALVEADVSDVIFTSGATEANNLVLQGFNLSNCNPILLVSAIEHKSVLNTANALLENEKADVKIIPVKSDGIINLLKFNQILDNIPKETICLASIMLANSETGVIQPMEKIIQLTHEHNSLIHSDITQAVGKISLDVIKSVDFMSLSSHKLYGPKGIGALIAKRRARKYLTPILYGGGQENDLRSGTLNVPGIVGFGKACEIASNDQTVNGARQIKLRIYLEGQLKSKIPNVIINAEESPRLPNTTSVCFPRVLADALLNDIPFVAMSSGSACSSNTLEPSHVLTAMGLSSDHADESIRISLGRDTTKDDINQAVEHISMSVDRLTLLGKMRTERVETGT